MSTSDEALRGVIDEVVLALAPLVDAAQAPEDFTRLLAELGWTVASIPRPLLDLATAGSSLLDALGSEPGELPTVQLLTSIGGLVSAIDAIRAQPDSAFPADVDIASFKQTIGRDLLDYCVVDYLLGPRFKFGRLLKLMGIIQLIETPASGLRQTYLKRYVNWAGVGTLLTNPVSGFRNAYAWSSATPQLPNALSDIAAVLESFDLQLSSFRLDAEQLAFANAGAPVPLPAQLGVCVDLNEALGVPHGSEAGVRFLVRAPTAARGPALAILPFANLSSSTGSTDDDSPSLTIQGDANLTQGFAVTLAPGHDPVVEAGFLGGQTTTNGPTNLQAALRVPPAPGEFERIIVGAPDASRLSLHTVTVSAGATLISEQKLDAFVELGLDKLRVVVKPAADDADSFISSLLGPDGISAELSLGLRLSSVTGFHFTGSGGLEGSFPVGVRLGPVDVQGISIGLKPNAQGVDFEVGASVRGSIGPVTAVIDRVGFKLISRFPDPPVGNFGPLDLALGFKPPSGIGLSVEAQGVLTGGGFLFHDEAQQLYAGVMQLSLHEQITLKAFGLIATRMPDGSRGYSLIIFITAEDFRPIPLGLGFTLQGIGGMVAVHRTFDENALREGLKSDTLSQLLFPRDPVGNAPAIIRALASAFPPMRGSYLLGILARIGWFTPTLIQMDLALILQFGASERLLVLGRISSLLPSPDNDLVRLNLDVMGVLDFDQGTASVDGVLVDSRLVHKFALTGAMAMRARWSSGPGSGFVLAVGGFNPRFAPPAGVPPLARVAIALCSGDNPRLTCEAYFALTSNTVQFGARAALYAAAYGFSVQGDVGYDVLLQIAPLHFIADFHASVQLKHGSSNLFSVSLAGSLEGPRPLRVSGKASFSIFWCDFSVRFDKTLIDGEPPPPPLGVDVLAALKAALSTAQSWTTQLPAERTHGVALRTLTPGTTLILDPLGRLAVKQQVAPLNSARDIDLYGGAPVIGDRRFTLAATLNGQPLQTTQTLRDQFAPAQLFAMSDDEKLAAPSFEQMDAGLVFGSDAVSFDATQLVAANLQYESIVIDAPIPEGAPLPPSQVYTLQPAQLAFHSLTGAAARAPVRRVGRARFRTPDAAPAVSLAKPAWDIVPLDGGAPAPLDPAVRTWSEHLAVLNSLNRAGAHWQLVPANEVTA